MNRRILRLAVPNLFASLSVPLIGIADTAMIGHLPDVALLGAVATASVVFDFLYWSVGFLRMGTTSIVTQYWGAGDLKSCSDTLFRALLIALIMAAVIIIFRSLIAGFGFQLAGGSGEVQEWGKRYFEIRVFGAPFALCNIALYGFFIGMANAVAPLGITVVAALVNVLADYMLIFGHWGAPALGIEGAAWAALIANVVATALGVAILAWRYGSLIQLRVRELFDAGRLKHLMRTNLGLLGRTLFLLAAQFASLSFVSRSGDIPLAAHAILLQIWALVSFGVDGFAHAAEALVGNLLGAREFQEARRFARRLMVWGVSIGAGFGMVYFLWMDAIARCFTEHEDVLQVILALTPIIASIQPLNAAVFILDGILIGANDIGYMVKAMAVATMLLFVPAAIVFIYWMDLGILGAWLAYSGLMVGRFLTLSWRYRGDRWLRTFV